MLFLKSFPPRLRMTDAFETSRGFHMYVYADIIDTHNEKFGTFSQTFQGRFFLENWHTQSQGIYKKGPQHRSM